MVEITDKLINQNRDRKYPYILDEKDDAGVLIHRQITFGPDRFALLIRHFGETKHLCGYVHIPQLDWKRIETLVRNAIWPLVTYAGGSTKFISWKIANTQGRLAVPVILDVESGEDFWVGFDFYHQPDITTDEAYAVLIGFENHIWRARHGDLTS